MQLFFPAGWESVDGTTVFGKLDCIVIEWRETAVCQFSATCLIKFLASFESISQSTECNTQRQVPLHGDSNSPDQW